jgi:hypothetical protein
MGGFRIQSNDLCDSMMNDYVQSKHYTDMEDYAIARMKNFRNNLNDRQRCEFNQIMDEVNKYRFTIYL